MPRVPDPLSLQKVSYLLIARVSLLQTWKNNNKDFADKFANILFHKHIIKLCIKMKYEKRNKKKIQYNGGWQREQNISKEKIKVKI